MKQTRLQRKSPPRAFPIATAAQLKRKRQSQLAWRWVRYLAPLPIFLGPLWYLNYYFCRGETILHLALPSGLCLIISAVIIHSHYRNTVFRVPLAQVCPNCGYDDTYRTGELFPGSSDTRKITCQRCSYTWPIRFRGADIFEARRRIYDAPDFLSACVENSTFSKQV